MRGAFITVEGIDGAGKTTHLESIQQILVAQDIPFLLTREPGGTELGEKLRELLLDGQDLAITNETELLLMFAARQQHLQQVIRPNLLEQTWILCDRFSDASYAYQGYGRGIDLTKIATLENWVQDGLSPDMTLVFDVSVEVGTGRTSQRANTPDRFEQEALSFKQRVREGYLERAKSEPERIRVIDSSVSVDQVGEIVETEMREFIKRWQA